MTPNKILKGILQFLAQLAVLAALLVALSILWRGMYLIGIPSADSVAEVSVSYPALTREVKTFRDPETLELAVKLSGFLRYDLFAQPDASGEPLITLSYLTIDGDTVTVSANRTTVWWRGQVHAIKDPDLFVNLTEGILFQEEARSPHT